MTRLLEGKTALIFGVANDHSIAWGIAKAMHDHGARLAFSYAVESLERRVRPLAASVGSTFVEPCDVTNDEQIEALFRRAAADLGVVDILVHAVAFAGRDELSRPYHLTSRAGFLNALDISAYSLTALTRGVAPLMKNGGSVLALTYYGSEKVMPNYNVMGVAKAGLESSVRYLAVDFGPQKIRVNAISAGPIKTLAASGVHGLSKMLEHHRTHAPLRKNTEQEEVGDAALFLVSHLSRGITGEVVHVDGGFHVLGMSAL
jgi:enoyl-[acyl-carrier protein] reductase I